MLAEFPADEMMKSDKRMRFGVLVFTAAASLFTGIVLLDLYWAERYVTYGGYPLILAAFLVFAWYLGREVADRWIGIGAWFSRERCIAAAIICSSSAFFFLHEPIGFKVLLDEAVLVGTSMMMHFEKVVLVPSAANSYEGSFRVVEAYLDKRTLFHPFLVSLLHDFSGYRPANVFILNIILTPVFLTLAWLFGHRLSGFRGGLLTVLLLTSVPLIAQNVTGGHFEILNLVMLSAVVLLACRYLERPDDRSLILLCYAGILLAQTRYESVLFVLPVGIVVLLGWHRNGEPILPWPVVLAPFLLSAFPAHFRVVLSKTRFWQLSEFDHGSAFSFGYLEENYGHALSYLFYLGQNLSNSFLVSVTGSVALVFFLGAAAVRFGNWYREDVPHFVLTLFLGTVLASFGLVLCYHWGQLDDLVASRFCLPLLLVFIFSTVAVVRADPKPYLVVCLVVATTAVAYYLSSLDSEGFLRSGFTLLGFMSIIIGASVPVLRGGIAPFRFFTVLTMAFIFFVTLPWNANHRFSQRYTPAREMEIMLRFIEEHPRKDYFFITNNPQIIIAHLVAGVAFRRVNEKPETVERHIAHKSYSDFFVYQKIEIDLETDRETVADGYQLDPVFRLETIEEQRIIPGLLGRISRIVKVDQAGVSGSD